MDITKSFKTQVSEAIQQGLPICEKPYHAIAESLGCNSVDVIEAIRQLQQDGSIKRFGVVVKHRKLGYDANAMVVWNVDDNEVEQLGKLFAKENAVTLCYQRPRRPNWPYNLFTMLHGKQRTEVIQKLEAMITHLKIDAEHEVLFSTKCFKQRGAHYQNNELEQNDRKAAI